MHFADRYSERWLIESPSNGRIFFERALNEPKFRGAAVKALATGSIRLRSRGDTSFEEYHGGLDTSENKNTYPAAFKQTHYRGWPRGIHAKSPLST